MNGYPHNFWFSRFFQTLRINQDQSKSISINKHQSASIRINQHQSESISINQNQSESISINRKQSASIRINQYQFALISINQHQSLSPPPSSSSLQANTWDGTVGQQQLLWKEDFQWSGTIIRFITRVFNRCAIS